MNQIRLTIKTGPPMKTDELYIPQVADPKEQVTFSIPVVETQLLPSVPGNVTTDTSGKRHIGVVGNIVRDKGGKILRVKVGMIYKKKSIIILLSRENQPNIDELQLNVADYVEFSLKPLKDNRSGHVTAYEAVKSTKFNPVKRVYELLKVIGNKPRRIPISNFLLMCHVQATNGTGLPAAFMNEDKTAFVTEQQAGDVVLKRVSSSLGSNITMTDEADPSIIFNIP